MNTNTNFNLIYNQMSTSDQAKVNTFFAKLSLKLSAISNNHKKLMVDDFKNAIIYYYNNNWNLDKILSTISTNNLANFYSTQSDIWFPLDNGAKIFPLTITGKWMSVFRLSVYLSKNVIPQLLQLALTFTIKRFPSFATTVKKGVFWHYIDSNIRRYKVYSEVDEQSLTQIKLSSYNSQTFKVLYYKNRISVEFFHILTDGSGGIIFLKTLIAEYLRLCDIQVPQKYEILDINSAPNNAEWTNDYKKADKIKTKGSLMSLPAVQIKSTFLKHYPSKILHFNINAKSFNNIAKQQNTTVTTLMVAYIFLATKKAVKSSHGNIQLQIPINVRKYYNSISLRNFTIFATIKLPIDYDYKFDELIFNIKTQLKTQTTKSYVDNQLNLINNSINTLKLVPLPIKRIFALGSRIFGVKLFSNSLSNLGVINTPDEFSQHINKMDFTLTNPTNNRVSCAMITYNNNLVLSIAKSTKHTTFEENLFTILKNEGLEITVEGN